jgi:hypothetical protein
LFQNLGFDNSSMMSMLGQMVASPDSMTGKLLNNTLGGNPMAASMQLYAGLAGANTMGAFGRTSAISAGETESVMQALANNFYKRQEYEGQGGIREGIKKDTAKFLTREAERGPEGIKYLESLGIKGLELGEDGKLTEKAKQRISEFDLTAEADETSEEKGKKIRQTAVTGVVKDIGLLLKEQDADIKKQLDERLEKQLLARKVATKSQLDSSRDQNGLLDPTKLKTLVDQYTDKGIEAPDTEESKIARKEIQTDLEKKLDKAATEKTEKASKEMIDSLVAFNIVTPQQAEDLKNKDGGVKIAEVSNMIKKYGAGEETLAEQPTQSEIIRDRIATKELAANELSSAMQGLETAKNKKDTNKIQEYNQKIQNILESNKLVPVGKEMIQYQDKEGGFDTEKLDPIVEGLRTRSEDERLYKRSEFFKEKGFRYKNYDFEKSRGFKLEDFTSAYYKAADLRMLGDSRNMSPAEAMDRLSKNAGGAMSAARSVFGDKSGSELVANMSELVGSSDVDLGSEQGASKMEDLLRRVKATQRVAGISIQTMLAIIKSGQELAANNPNLQFANSSANTELALKAVRTAADSGRMMSGADYRQAGGNQAMAMGEIQESQAFAQSPIGNAYATFLAAAKGKTFTDKDGNVRDSTEALKEMARNGKLTAKGLAQGGLDQVAEILGTTAAEVSYQANNPLLAQEAMRDEGIMKAVYEAKDSSVTETMFSGLERAGVDREDLIKKYKQAKQEGKTDDDFFIQEVIPNLNESGQELFRQQKGTFARSLRKTLRTPEENERMEKLIDRQAQDDKEVAKQLDSKRAPIVTQVIEAIASGADISQDAVMEGLSNIFTTKDVTKDETKQAVEKALVSASDLNAIVGDKTKTDDQKIKSGAVDKINDILKARVDKAKEQGKSTDVVANVTKEKLELVRDTLGNMGGVSNLKEAKAKLADLQKRRNKLSDPQKRELAALEAAKEMGLMSSEQSFKRAKGKTLEEISAGVVQGYADEEVKQIIEKREDVEVKQMGERLTEQSKQAPVGEAEKKEQEELQKAMKFYTKKDAAGKEYVDWKELYKDKADKTRKKAPGEKANFFAEEDKKVKSDFENVQKNITALEKTQDQTSSSAVAKREEIAKTLKSYGATDDQLKSITKQDGSYDLAKLKELTGQTQDKTSYKSGSSTLNRAVDEVRENLKAQEESLTAKGKSAGEDPFQKELGEAFKSLGEMIRDGGGIRSALEALSTALTTTKG